MMNSVVIGWNNAALFGKWARPVQDGGRRSLEQQRPATGEIEKSLLEKGRKRPAIGMTHAAQTNLTNLLIGSWAFSPNHGEPVRIPDVEMVWNHTVYQIWIPRLATVERVSAESLSSARPTKATGLDRIAYAVAAAQIADALTQDVLLAPLQAGVIPLPHQLFALTRAMLDPQG